MIREIIAEFFDQERRKLRNFVRRLIKDASDRDAEDVIQDVALNLFNKTNFDQPLENLAAYIYRSLRNYVIDIYRKKRHTVTVEETDFPPDHSDPEAKMIDLEIQENVFAALEKLPEKYRKVWIAVELEGRNYKELSLSWGIPKNTLLSHKHRAEIQLREILSEFYENL